MQPDKLRHPVGTEPYLDGYSISVNVGRFHADRLEALYLSG